MLIVQSSVHVRAKANLDKSMTWHMVEICWYKSNFQNKNRQRPNKMTEAVWNHLSCNALSCQDQTPDSESQLDWNHLHFLQTCCPARDAGTPPGLEPPPSSASAPTSPCGMHEARHPWEELGSPVAVMRSWGAQLVAKRGRKRAADVLLLRKSSSA